MRGKALGGFFELEFPAAKPPLHSDTVKFQSARAAFLALLRAGRPRRVWMPYYTCFTMLASLRQAGVDVVFYSIDRQFRIADDIILQEGDWLLYTNYFGLCTENAVSVIKRFGAERVVIDASQALFSGPFDCLATIYSPRKFLGVPDGGLLATCLHVEEPAHCDDGSFDRAISLLKRAAFSPEVAYAEHHCAEETLFDQEPAAMSVLTRRMLAGIDYPQVARVRNRNFAYLHDRLGRHNLMDLGQLRVEGPMCYPLLVNCDGLRKLLISKRIYVPTYWRDVLELVPSTSTEAYLVDRLVPLPCDQRYDEEDMERVVDTCLNHFSNVLPEDVMEIQE
ncbi:hypothetical protein GCM10027343_19180 [Noviherbaspirillum agri]